MNDTLDIRQRGPELTSPVTDRAGPRKGFILWFTGMSGAGKSTLAARLRPIFARGRPTEILDGDEVRNYLSRDLSYSRADRDLNVSRIGFVARLLARNGVATIVAAISPYQEARAEVRRLAVKDELPFVEVYVRANLSSLIARDVKGLYRRAIAGELCNFTGISDPYEEPREADVIVNTDQEPVEASLRRVGTLLMGRGLI